MARHQKCHLFVITSELGFGTAKGPLKYLSLLLMADLIIINSQGYFVCQRSCP